MFKQSSNFYKSGLILKNMHLRENLIVWVDIYYALLAQLSTTFILLKFTFLKILDFV